MYRKSLLLGLMLGGVAALLTLELPHFMTLNPVIFVLLLPGVLASIAAAGHVHAYRTWVAALVNAFLWFALSTMLGIVFQWTLKMIARRRSGAHGAGTGAMPSDSEESFPDRSRPR